MYKSLLNLKSFVRKHTLLQKVCTRIMLNFVVPQKFVAKHKLFQKYFLKHTPLDPQKIMPNLDRTKISPLSMATTPYNKFAKPCQDIYYKTSFFKFVAKHTHLLTAKQSFTTIFNESQDCSNRLC